MKPMYQIKAWQEDDWWLVRVVAASEDADTTPLNALTQARSLARIESMGRDLIATILDAEDDTFDIEVEYVLTGDAGELVRQAKRARAWLDAAQDLWQEQSTMAARTLADKGYSLRETATLLRLSHQRVDQLLGSRADHEQSKAIVVCEGKMDAMFLRQIIPPERRESLPDFVVFVPENSNSWRISHGENVHAESRTGMERTLKD
jgi:hypothetical protein